MKIIYITTNFLADDSGGPNKQKTSFEDAHFGAWQSRFAREMKSKYPDTIIECWSSYNVKFFGDRGISRLHRGGIDFVLLPAMGISHNLNFPYSMIQSLRKLSKSNSKTVIHMQSLHTIPAYIISYFCSNLPLVCQHRAPAHLPFVKYFSRENPRSRFSYYLMQIVDDYCLRHYDFIFVPSHFEAKYLSSRLGENKVQRLKGGGFSFDKIKPITKKEARKKLGLPIDKKIILHVGRFDDNKGLDVLSSLYKSNYKDDNGVICYAIGGNKKAELHQELVNSGLLTMERMPKKKAITFINAADVLVHPIQNQIYSTYGDMCNVVLEALSLNCPVIGPQLKYFEKEDRRNLGFMASNKKRVRRSINLILNGYKFNGSKMREIVKKYYSWSPILERNYQIYEKLYGEYYE